MDGTIDVPVAVAAWEDLCAGAPEIETERAPGLVAFRARAVDHLLFNRLVVTGDAEMGPAVEKYAAAGIERYWVQVVEPGSPRVLRAVADLDLFPWRRDWITLARTSDAPPAPRTDLAIQRATPADREAISHIMGPAFDLPGAAAVLFGGLASRPGWHVYVAREGGTAVAAGAMYVRGDAAYLAVAATLPAFRHRGAHRALLARRIRVAHGLGCTQLWAETGEAIAGEPNPSERNLHAAGFAQVGRTRIFSPAGTTWLR